MSRLLSNFNDVFGLTSSFRMVRPAYFTRWDLSFLYKNILLVEKCSTETPPLNLIVRIYVISWNSHELLWDFVVLYELRICINFASFAPSLFKI